jgi:D-serine deaminase-like pyridoxal phosphate-dependent protein
MTELLGQEKDQLDTPALLVDLDLFEANVHTLAKACADHGVAWRPHSKAHKCPDIARIQIEAGAQGIICAKLSEAEVMVEHGVDDILIANEIVTPAKLQRLASLQARARVMCCVDDVGIVDVISASAAAEGAVIPVYIDIDNGMDRTGVGPGKPALELAMKIHESEGIELAGIMGYEGQVLDIKPLETKRAACHEALALLVETHDLLAANGIHVDIVSAGGTGCYPITVAYPGITELQAGGGIFMDLFYRDECLIEDLQLALTVLTTVVSKHPRHIIVDGGFKTMCQNPQPRPIDHDELELRGLSAEHGIFNVKPGLKGPDLGDRIEFYVGYSDSTNFLHNQFIGIRQNRVEKVWPLVGRGKLT